jgi:putative ABC transport system ATP-binding protein
LFCDEPTGNLDSTNSKMISDLLFDVFNESSTALIIVTHDEDLADRCDQKIRLIDGKVQ